MALHDPGTHPIRPRPCPAAAAGTLPSQDRARAFRAHEGVGALLSMCIATASCELRSDDTDAHCSAPCDEARAVGGDSPDGLSIKPTVSLLAAPSSLANRFPCVPRRSSRASAVINQTSLFITEEATSHAAGIISGEFLARRRANWSS